MIRSAPPITYIVATRICEAARRGATGYAGAVPALERLAKGDDLEIARFAEDALKLLRK